MSSDFEFDIDDIDFSSESFSDQLEKIRSLPGFWSKHRDWVSLYDTINDVFHGAGYSRGEFREYDLISGKKPTNPWHYDTVAREGNLTEEELLDRQRKLFSMLDAMEFPRLEFVEMEALNYQNHKSYDDDFDKALREYRENKEKLKLKEELEKEQRSRREAKEREDKQALFNKCRALLDEAEKVESEITTRRKKLLLALECCRVGIFGLALTMLVGGLSGEFLSMGVTSFFGIICLLVLRGKCLGLVPDYPEETHEIRFAREVCREPAYYFSKYN